VRFETSALKAFSNNILFFLLCDYIHGERNEREGGTGGVGGGREGGREEGREGGRVEPGAVASLMTFMTSSSVMPRTSFPFTNTTCAPTKGGSDSAT
jgi:hypothetical protein